MISFDCKKASIYSLQNIHLCDAAVSNVEEDSVILTMKDSSADFLISEVYVTFFDGSKGLATYFCELSQYKEMVASPGVLVSRVHCKIGEEISILQRRNDIKVNVNIPIDISYRSSNNIPGTMRNISAGGIFFTCHRSMAVGDILSFKFSPRKDIAPLNLRITILRIQSPELLREMIGKEANDPLIAGYGCRFTGLSPHEESQVRNFVFRQDLIRHKRVSALR